MAQLSPSLFVVIFYVICLNVNKLFGYQFYAALGFSQMSSLFECGVQHNYPLHTVCGTKFHTLTPPACPKFLICSNMNTFGPLMAYSGQANVSNCRFITKLSNFRRLFLQGVPEKIVLIIQICFFLQHTFNVMLGQNIYYKYIFRREALKTRCHKKWKKSEVF